MNHKNVGFIFKPAPIRFEKLWSDISCNQIILRVLRVYTEKDAVGRLHFNYPLQKMVPQSVIYKRDILAILLRSNVPHPFTIVNARRLVILR